jgi:hypothetical protein
LEEERERLAAEREARIESEVGQRLTQLLLHRRLAGELPDWAARLAPEVVELLTSPREPWPGTAGTPTASERAEHGEEVPVVAMRRWFMQERELRGVELKESGGRDGEDREAGEDWLGSADLLRLIRRDARGKLVLGEDGVRKLLRQIGQLQVTVHGRQAYVAHFDQVLQALAERSLLDEATLTWWKAYTAAKTEARTQPARDSSPVGWAGHISAPR